MLKEKQLPQTGSILKRSAVAPDPRFELGQPVPGASPMSSSEAQQLSSRSWFTKGVCNKGGFNKQGAVETTELQTPLLQTSFGSPKTVGRLY